MWVGRRWKEIRVIGECDYGGRSGVADSCDLVRWETLGVSGEHGLSRRERVCFWPALSTGIAWAWLVLAGVIVQVSWRSGWSVDRSRGLSVRSISVAINASCFAALASCCSSLASCCAALAACVFKTSPCCLITASPCSSCASRHCMPVVAASRCWGAVGVLGWMT